MIIFEKNNKLNINFENQLDNPDIEIGKSEIKVDGNNIVNGGSGLRKLVLYGAYDETLDRDVAYKDEEHTQRYESYDEAVDATSQADIVVLYIDRVDGNETSHYISVCDVMYYEYNSSGTINRAVYVLFNDNQFVLFDDSE